MTLTPSRRWAAIAAATTLFVSVVATSGAAHADDSSTLTVLGTSDVSDSGLVANVLKPGFERLHPDVTLNYIGSASGQAITAAEGGQGSALIVHAASLENSFVDGGYSLEPAGRAIFYGDFVLAGPANDPAGVLGGGSAPAHDIVTAFEKIAAAGTAGMATFVSRGGQTGTSGTTVAEHQIWSLATQSADLTLCDVTAGGGGKAPATATGNCASNPPSWYAATSLKQGANVQAADTCPAATFPNGGCYVFTDRGTFDYLNSQALLTKLKVLVRDNDDSARGGDTLLTNSFHAYAINPAKFAGNPNVTINSTAATEFLDYLTSPATQDAVGAYLANSKDGGAPFLPDARPTITASTPPTSVKAGSPVTITGTVSNVVPGTPPLSGKPVKLIVTPQVGSAGAYVAATGSTDTSGDYELTFTPVGAVTYTVTTPTIKQVEQPALNPPFSDLLQPATGSASAPVAVQSALGSPTFTGGRNVVSGSVRLLPTDGYQVGSLQLYAARYTGKPVTLKYVASLDLPRGRSLEKFSYFLPSGKWVVQLGYNNPGVILRSVTTSTLVSIAAG